MPSTRRKIIFARKNGLPYALPAWHIKSNPPVMNMTAKPIFDQRSISVITVAARLPASVSPSRCRSKITIIPTESGSARMWLPSSSGNSQIDSAIAVDAGVCSSH